MTDTQGKPRELLPCPFCGGDAGIVTEDRTWIECLDCPSSISSGPFDTDSEAIDAWNTRAVLEGFALVPIKATPEIRAALRLGSRKDYPSDEMCNVRWAAAIAALRAEVEALKSADEESCAVVDKLARLLAEIAVTLKGPEPDMTRWSYHDLPQLVSEMKGRSEKAESALAGRREDAERYRWLRSPTAPGYLHFPGGEMEDGLALSALDAAIDAARAK